MTKPKLKSKVSAKTEQSKESLGKSIMESAQQIWLAGLGAFAKAQEEGTKLFENLVKEGTVLEQKTRHFTHGKVEEVRGAVESSVGQVKERTQETWDKLEKVFEDRVSRALHTLGVPGNKELQAVVDRIEELARDLRKATMKAIAPLPSKPVAKAAAPKVPAPKAVAPKAAASKAAAPKKAKTRDELSDLAKDLEEAQLAAKKTAKRSVASVRKTAKTASKK